MDLQFMKAGTSDALVLTGISRQAFDSDVKAGAASSGGPPGYQSVCPDISLSRSMSEWPERIIYSNWLMRTE